MADKLPSGLGLDMDSVMMRSPDFFALLPAGAWAARRVFIHVEGCRIDRKFLHQPYTIEIPPRCEKARISVSPDSIGGSWWT